MTQTPNHVSTVCPNLTSSRLCMHSQALDSGFFFFFFFWQV